MIIDFFLGHSLIGPLSNFCMYKQENSSLMKLGKSTYMVIRWAFKGKFSYLQTRVLACILESSLFPFVFCLLCTLMNI